MRVGRISTCIRGTFLISQFRLRRSIKNSRWARLRSRRRIRFYSLVFPTNWRVRVISVAFSPWLPLRIRITTTRVMMSRVLRNWGSLPMIAMWLLQGEMAAFLCSKSKYAAIPSRYLGDIMNECIDLFNRIEMHEECGWKKGMTNFHLRF